MSMKKNRRSAALLWILCAICVLFSRICFDNVQTDPYLAYLEAAAGGTDRTADASAFSAPQRGVQTQQAYVPENYAQDGGYAYLPRKTAQRTSVRSVINSVSCLLTAGIFSSVLFFGHTVFFSDGLCGIISNTVILRYIHGQDGEKA